MTNANLGRKRADLEKVRGRLIEAKKKDPELTPLQLGSRFGISHVTVRRVLREAGLYAEPVSRRKGPPCGHSACSQHYIDTGKPWCVEAHDIECDLDEDCTCATHGSSMVTWRPR